METKSIGLGLRDASSVDLLKSLFSHGFVVFSYQTPYISIWNFLKNPYQKLAITCTDSYVEADSKRTISSTEYVQSKESDK